MPELREDNQGEGVPEHLRVGDVFKVHGDDRPRLPGFDDVKARILQIPGFVTCQRCRGEVEAEVMMEHRCD